MVAMTRPDPTPDRWVIHTIRLVQREDGSILATDGLSGAQVLAPTGPGAFALLGYEIQRRYRALAASPGTYPHERRQLEDLDRFWKGTP